MLSVDRAGLQTLVVDAGRPGYAHLGVPRSGALDRESLARANAVVGNPPDAAGLECLLRGPLLRARRRFAAVAPGFEVTTVDTLDLRALPTLRVWVAVTGGIAITPVLGSRSADLVGRLGPAPLRDGAELPLGPDRPPAPPTASAAPPAPPTASPDEPFRLRTGPDHLDLAAGPWTVGRDSDRTALRLSGPARAHSLPGRTRGLVPGAVQVTPDGSPVVFLAGHPATGGYPIAGFVRTADLGRLAQLRPGQSLSLRIPRVRVRAR